MLAITKYSYLLLGTLALSPTVIARPGVNNNENLQQQHQLPMQYDGSSQDTSPMDEVIAESPLLSLHRSLVEIESLSDNELSLGEFISEYLKTRNFTVKKQKVPVGSYKDSSESKNDSDEETENPGNSGEQYRYNILAFPSGHPSPDIILSSHIDTVPPFIPYSLSNPSGSNHDFKREDILISGRGTVDAKGSVACQIIAALSHQETNPNTPVGLLFVVSEETGGTGMTHFSTSPFNPTHPAFHTVIFGEPTERALVSGHKGALPFSLSVKGKSAHSGYPWLGRSAISTILPILTRLDALGDIPESDGGLPASEKYGRTTVNVGKIRAGVAGNVVPDSASALVMLRLASGTSKEAIEIVTRAIEHAVKESGGDIEDVELQFNLSHGHGPIDLDADIDGFNVTTVNYSTDVPKWHINERADGSRVKRYLYGPGSILVAHGPDEGLTVGELEAGLEGYTRLIEAAAKRGD